MPLQIYNTLSRQLEAFASLESGHVRMYVCGITVYDRCHVGHARSAVAFDVARRWLRAQGWRVTFVRNITDIDDKIIKRAVENGEPIRALTERMIAAMYRDFDALGIERPTFDPRATDYVPQMLDIVRRLEDKGLAYRTPAGDVNYAVRKFPGYGKLSGKSLDELQAGERVAVADDKVDPMDFVLWKSTKPDEPADARWDSGYGPGRPGWHIECSAMACALLGETFDIHGGGADLQFPHHENEIAQSEGAHGQTLARFWMHNGFVNVDNEKMSKSLGNFFTIEDVLKTFDAETLRFFIVRSHYRSPLNYSDAHIDDARSALRRLYTALQAVPGQDSSTDGEVDWTDPYAQRFAAAMNNDFGTPEAVAVLFELASETNRSRSLQRAALLKRLGGVLGLLQQDPTSFLQGGRHDDVADIERMIADRAAAKAAKNFAEADRIRQALLSQGVVLKDSPTGTTWERV
jgi:cysteinyl-tRNA synthetase